MLSRRQGEKSLTRFLAIVVCLGSAWDSAYSTAEVNAITNYVGSGGGLLIMGDNTDCPNGNVQPVATPFGAISLGG